MINSFRMFRVTCRIIQSNGTIFSSVGFKNGPSAAINLKNTFFTFNQSDLAKGHIASTPMVNVARNYAKGKDKKKEKGKMKVHIDEHQLSQVIHVDAFKSQMQKGIDILKDDFTKHLSLRSSTGAIESIIVELEGEEHTLQELAQITRKNPKLVVINMSAFPQTIPAALQAISKSGMNLNPQQEGTTLYIPVPKVTKEHRENLAKNAKQLFVKCKDHIRDIQIRQTKSLRKKDGVSEDVIRNVEQQITALADVFLTEAQKILESKQSELLGKD